MSNNSLAQTYSRSSGLKLNRPVINIAPYSIPFNKYIVYSNSSGNDNKNYDYFQETIDFILPELKKNNISIIQIGNGKDRPLEGCYFLQGKTTLAQTAFIIKNSLLLVGNDSMPVHLAGVLDIPSISIYGPTSIENHGPYWKNVNSVFLEGDRQGKMPTFSFNESPKTVNSVKPEKIVEEVFKILNIDQKTSITSVFFGDKFTNKVVETVLDAIVPADFISNAPLNIRYDYHPTDEYLAAQLSVRKSLIVTDKNIDLRLIENFQSQIIGIAYNITEKNDPKFIERVQKLGILITLFSRLPEEKINDYKLDYAEIGLILNERTKIKGDIPNNENISSSSSFKTNKIILSNGKIYPSNAHRLLDIPAENGKPIGGNVLDTPKFFEELDYFYIFNT